MQERSDSRYVCSRFQETTERGRGQSVATVALECAVPQYGEGQQVIPLEFLGSRRRPLSDRNHLETARAELVVVLAKLGGMIPAEEAAEVAEKYEHERDTWLARYHQYEFASAAFQIGIVLASAAVITGIVALAWLASLAGVLGLAFMALGLLAPHAIHLAGH